MKFLEKDFQRWVKGRILFLIITAFNIGKRCAAASMFFITFCFLETLYCFLKQDGLLLF